MGCFTQRRHRVLPTWASNLNYGGVGGKWSVRSLCGGVPGEAEVEHDDRYVCEDGKPVSTVSGGLVYPLVLGSPQVLLVVRQPYVLSNKFKFLGNFLVAVSRWCSSRASIKPHVFPSSSLRLISLSHNVGFGFFLTGPHHWHPIALSHGNFEVICVWLPRRVLLCVPLPLTCGIGLISSQWDPAGWLSYP